MCSNEQAEMEKRSILTSHGTAKQMSSCTERGENAMYLVEITAFC